MPRQAPLPAASPGSAYCYQVYGLCLGANRPIPNLIPAAVSVPVDVQVEWAGHQPFPVPLTPAEHWPADLERAGSSGGPYTLDGLRGPDGDRYVRLRFDGNGKYAEFTLSLAADRVWVSWPDNASYEHIVSLFLRPALALVLWLRGAACLHASVVALQGRAVIFAGVPGAGKSSTATAFARLGHAVLADDMAVLEDLGESFLVQPGYPALTLLPNSAAALVGPAELPPLWRGDPRRALVLSATPDPAAFRFEPQPLPLAAVYLLGPRRVAGLAPWIEPISPAHGLPLLVANKFSGAYFSRQHRAREFDLLSRVARRVPLRHMRCPADLAALPAVCEAVLNDLAALPAW